MFYFWSYLLLVISCLAIVIGVGLYRYLQAKTMLNRARCKAELKRNNFHQDSEKIIIE